VAKKSPARKSAIIRKFPVKKRVARKVAKRVRRAA